jgi:hypothetical protein
MGAVWLHIAADSEPESSREGAVSAIGFAIALFLTWYFFPSSIRRTLDWVDLWLLAGQYTIPVFAITAASVWAASVLLEHRSNPELVLDIAAAGSWFPPLAIFLWENSRWASVAAAVLSVGVSRCFLSGSGSRRIIETGIGRAFLVALMLESALVAGASHRWRTAALLTILTFSLLTWMLTRTNVWPVGGNRFSRVRVVPALFLSLTFSAGGFTPFLQHGSGSGGPYNGGSGDVAVDSWPGVILWTGVQPHSIVAPVPRKPAGKRMFRSAIPDLASIPFSGAYHYYRGHTQAPNAYVTYGDATVNTYRSTDHRPLTMEARQHLATLIDMSCCAEIRLEVRNSDREPSAVRVELVLRNTTLSGSPSESLGSVPVDFPDGPGTLRFKIPVSTAIRQFDEFTVRFHLLPPRADRGARIAIDRFLLIPHRT